MNEFLAEIEKVGELYGLKLNKQKCEVMYSMLNANVHFSDGTKVQHKDEVKYLGCLLNSKADAKVELKKRMAEVVAIMKNKSLTFQIFQNIKFLKLKKE